MTRTGFFASLLGVLFAPEVLKSVGHTNPWPLFEKPYLKVPGRMFAENEKWYQWCRLEFDVTKGTIIGDIKTNKLIGRTTRDARKGEIVALELFT